MTGPGDPMAAAGGRGHLRASNADREQLIDALKAAFAAGRLPGDEFDMLVGRALVSRTYAQLASVADGIPRGPDPAQPPQRARAPQPALPVPPARPGFLAATALIAALWAGAWFSRADNAAVTMLIIVSTYFYLVASIIGGVRAAHSWYLKRSRGHPASGPGGQAPRCPASGGAGPHRPPRGGLSWRNYRSR